MVSVLFASLWTAFASPPETAKPWCYWWWVNGHVDRETIVADLTSMKDLGFGGVLMFDSRGYWDDADHVENPKADLGWGTDAWFDFVAFSIRECARLGLVFTMNASASGGTLNGFIDGKEYETDVMNREEVRAHLNRSVGPILRRVPDLVGKTFTHVYSVSYEGNVRTGGSWKAIKDNFYATMAAWAREHGLQIYSESGGPWFWGAQNTRLDCSQLDMLSYNDFPQGEFWPLWESGWNPETGHANANGRFFSRATVLAARREKRPIASLEAFTHMHRHWSVDPAYLKPLADQAYADGVNRLVWHTFTCSPDKFGVPGAEYFAGSHINRHVTWQKDGGAFVRYLGRCQALLQRGEPVDDGEFLPEERQYYGWGRFRKDGVARFTTTHRREGAVDFFFVAGEGAGEVLLSTSLGERPVELWDPVSVTRRRVDAVAGPGGLTRVALDLPKGGSCFLVFGAADALERQPAARQEATVDLQGPWHVTFAYPARISAPPPTPRTLDALKDFSEVEPQSGFGSTSVRHFSGTATYRTSFACTPGEAAAWQVLSVGELKTGTARVFVNGRDCGVVWCAPWEVRLPVGVLRAGENALEIRYTNNWCNRLVADCHLPPEDRVTRSTLHYWTEPRKGDFTNPSSLRPTICSGYAAGDPLQPAGLTGPVRFSPLMRAFPQ